VRFYDDFNILVERHEEAQKALDGKLPELTAEHLGDIGLFDAEQTGGRRLCQAACFHDGLDLEHQLRLDQVFFPVRHTDLLEDLLPASGGWFLAHGVPDNSTGWRNAETVEAPEVPDIDGQQLRDTMDMCIYICLVSCYDGLQGQRLRLG